MSDSDSTHYDADRIDKVNRAKAWLAEKWTTSHACPVCATDNWIVGAVADVPQWEVRRSAAAWERTYPSFLAVCHNCGYTMLFNALLSGVVTRSEGDDEATDEATEEAATE